MNTLELGKKWKNPMNHFIIINKPPASSFVLTRAFFLPQCRILLPFKGLDSSTYAEYKKAKCQYLPVDAA